MHEAIDDFIPLPSRPRWSTICVGKRALALQFLYGGIWVHCGILAGGSCNAHLNLRSARAHPSDITLYSRVLSLCGRRHLEPTTGVAKRGGTDRPSGHRGPRGDEGDSFRRRLSYGEPDARQA